MVGHGRAPHSSQISSHQATHKPTPVLQPNQPSHATQQPIPLATLPIHPHAGAINRAVGATVTTAITHSIINGQTRAPHSKPGPGRSGARFLALTRLKHQRPPQFVYNLLTISLLTPIIAESGRMFGFTSPEEMMRFPPFIRATYGLGSSIAILVGGRFVAANAKPIILTAFSTLILTATENMIRKEMKFMETSVYSPGKQPDLILFGVVILGFTAQTWRLLAPSSSKSGFIDVYLRCFLKSTLILNAAAALKCVLLGFGVADLRALRRGLFGVIERMFLIARTLLVSCDWTSYLHRAGKSRESSIFWFIRFFFLVSLLEDLCVATHAFAMLSTPIYTRVTPPDNENCPICCCSYENPVALRCGHVFCQACIDRWLCNGRTCPTCTQPVVTAQEVEFKDGSFPVEALLTCF